jgi:alkanesulfonate monooxygenase SsuD/methylene tetrahydromethanopterin reductase-like flavin-dependent oxidoreductase (luciferase family)
VRTIALPALEAGARRGHRHRPPLIVSAPIVRTTDFAIVQQRAQEAWAVYAALPAYQRMFHEGGYPLTPDGRLTEELIHELFLYGDEETIRQRLSALRAAGVDELVTPLSPGREAEPDQRALMELLASL